MSEDVVILHVLQLSTASCLFTTMVSWLALVAAAGWSPCCSLLCILFYIHAGLSVLIYSYATWRGSTTAWLWGLYFTVIGVDVFWSFHGHSAWLTVLVLPSLWAFKTKNSHQSASIIFCGIGTVAAIGFFLDYFAAPKGHCNLAAWLPLPLGILHRILPIFATALQFTILQRHKQAHWLLSCFTGDVWLFHAWKKLRNKVYRDDQLNSPRSPIEVDAALMGVRSYRRSSVLGRPRSPEFYAGDNLSLAALNSPSSRGPREIMNNIDAASDASGTRENPEHLQYVLFSSVLAFGGFAEVCLAMNINTGHIIAVKRLACGFTSDQAKALSREVHILKGLSHPNIVRYLGTDESEQFSIFMEYVPGGSLAALLDECGPLPERVLQIFLRQILDGLRYLHTKGITHRDIKAENILVLQCQEFVQLKLTDFGCSWEGDEAGNMESLTGTVLWMAPETARQETCNAASDIWSLGCTVIQLATATFPWQEKNFDNPLAALFYIAHCKEGPMIPVGVLSPKGVHFIQRCLQVDAEQRPTCAGLFEDPWVASQTSVQCSSSGDTHWIQVKRKQLADIPSCVPATSSGAPEVYELPSCGPHSPKSPPAVALTERPVVTPASRQPSFLSASPFAIPGAVEDASSNVPCTRSWLPTQFPGFLDTGHPLSRQSSTWMLSPRFPGMTDLGYPLSLQASPRVLGQFPGSMDTGHVLSRQSSSWVPSQFPGLSKAMAQPNASNHCKASNSLEGLSKAMAQPNASNHCKASNSLEGLSKTMAQPNASNHCRASPSLEAEGLTLVVPSVSQAWSPRKARRPDPGGEVPESPVTPPHVPRAPIVDDYVLQPPTPPPMETCIVQRPSSHGVGAQCAVAGPFISGGATSDLLRILDKTSRLSLRLPSYLPPIPCAIPLSPSVALSPQSTAKFED